MISPLLDKTLSGVPHADKNLKFFVISKIKFNKIKILNSFIFVKKKIIFILSGWPIVWEKLEKKKSKKIKMEFSST